MAVDRPVDYDPGDTGGSTPDNQARQERHREESIPARAEIVETRTRAEYYQALRVAAEQQDRAPDQPRTEADSRPRSAWDDTDAATRPPLDALRVPPERAIHILDGDATGGGHRYGTGKPGKTEFPASWADDKVMDGILSVARSPDSASLQQNGRWKVEGIRDEVKLSVIITADARIWSAYPLPGSPGVRQNSRDA